MHICRNILHRVIEEERHAEVLESFFRLHLAQQTGSVEEGRVVIRLQVDGCREVLKGLYIAPLQSMVIKKGLYIIITPAIKDISPAVES